MGRRVVLTTVVAALISGATADLQQPAPGGGANRTLTAVPGIKVGHFTLPERPTGCTVVLAESGAVAAVSQRGGAPATRETDLLNPLNTVDRVNAVVFSGGSAFGLESATGVVRWLDERNVGFAAGPVRVPIVPAAALFDLTVGSNPRIRPNADCGYKAAAAATSAAVLEGSVGAGAGATVGKFGGDKRPTKAGVGSAAIVLPNGLIVAAMVVVNALGDIINPVTGAVVAGARGADGGFTDARKILRSGGSGYRSRFGENTTLGVVATNAKLTKTQAARVSLMADDGYARALSPSHTLDDGDTIFTLATGRWDGNVNLTIVGGLAAEAVADAIVRAGTQATGVAGIPAARDLKK
jgi:L-aminopeptidase/D-esterase-like protein